jgi:hypothetical protein
MKGKKFFTVILEGQTYINILYLLLSFPLGIAYFVLLVTGVSLGLSLLVTLLGIPILVLTLFAWRGLGTFEHRMAASMLGEKMFPMSIKAESRGTLWSRFKGYLRNPVTWKTLGYLMLKFPLGILSFVIFVTLIAITLTFISVPFLYLFSPIELVSSGLDSVTLAFLFLIVGVFIGFLSILDALDERDGCCAWEDCFCSSWLKAGV